MRGRRGHRVDGQLGEGPRRVGVPIVEHQVDVADTDASEAARAERRAARCGGHGHHVGRVDALRAEQQSIGGPLGFRPLIGGQHLDPRAQQPHQRGPGQGRVPGVGEQSAQPLGEQADLAEGAAVLESLLGRARRDQSHDLGVAFDLRVETAGELVDADPHQVRPHVGVSDARDRARHQVHVASHARRETAVEDHAQVVRARADRLQVHRQLKGGEAPEVVGGRLLVVVGGDVLQRRWFAGGVHGRVPHPAAVACVVDDGRVARVGVDRQVPQRLDDRVTGRRVVLVAAHLERARGEQVTDDVEVAGHAGQPGDLRTDQQRSCGHGRHLIGWSTAGARRPVHREFSMSRIRSSPHV